MRGHPTKGPWFAWLRTETCTAAMSREARPWAVGRVSALDGSLVVLSTHRSHEGALCMLDALTTEDDAADLRRIAMAEAS